MNIFKLKQLEIERCASKAYEGVVGVPLHENSGILGHNYRSTVAENIVATATECAEMVAEATTSADPEISLQVCDVG